VVHDCGINPYCCGSIDFNRVGFSSRSIIKLSATLDKVDVNDTGLRSLLKSLIDLDLGIGVTSACFHAVGTVHS